ncbi:MAG: hypothetical protein LQ340_007774, partial [Diploschistes diacapsis]
MSTVKNLVNLPKPSNDTTSSSLNPNHLKPTGTQSGTPNRPRPITSPTPTRMSLSNKTALVTGGSKGIGASITAALVREGCRVVISYSSDSAAAESVVSAHGKDKVHAVKSDAGDLGDIEALVKETVDKFGEIDILIPNAGILPMKTLEETTPEDFERCMATNVKGPYFLCQ